MENQDYSNHTRWVKGYHFILSTLLVLGFIASLINVYRHIEHGNFLTSVLVSGLFFIGFFVFWFMRTFPLKAQDRAIRAEESLRYFILTGKALDSRITMSQIIGLRFASDDEFVALAARAAEEGLSQADIKKAIKNWRADNHRA